MSFARPRLWAGLLVVILVFSAVPMSLLAFPASETGTIGPALGPLDTTLTSIKIDSDADLNMQAIANSWPGDGTDLDPYLINALTLAANDSGPGLQVQNTTLHLKLQNIVVEDDCLDEYHPLISLYNASGIELLNVVAERDQTTSLQVSLVRNSSVSTCILGPVEFEDSSNITLTNNTIDESDGFYLSACEKIMISGNQLDSMGQFYINGCSNITLSNNIFQTVVQGVALVNSSNITFWSNIFLNCSICVPALAMGEDLFFRTLTATGNNTVNGLPLLFVRDIDLEGGAVPAGAGQILLYNVTNATVVGQYMNGTSNAITTTSCWNITISSNTINWSLYALAIADSHQVSVIGNDLLHCYEGVQTFSSEGLLISGNDMNGSYYFDSYDYIGTGEHGILLYLSWGEVLDNTIASYYYGLRLIQASGSEVTGNSLSHTYFGLRAETAIDLIVDNNTFFNGRDCIYISDSSEVLIINNTLSNAEYGCVFYYTDNCEVLGNHFHENINYGLYIYTGSDDNLIAGNLFSKNNGAGTVFSSSTVQAQDIGLRNRWNSTTGGNEWSDWPGPDVNADGFVDSPYPIDGSANAQDNLPLVSAAVRDDDIPPYLTITSPANGTWSDSMNLFVTWESGDNETGVVGHYISYDGSDWLDVGMATGSEVDAEDGTHVFSVMAVDMAGNSAIRNVTFTVDTTAPTVEILTPLQDQFFHVSDVDLTWQVQDASDVVCSWKVDGGPWNVATSNSAAVSNLTDGQHTLHLSCRDQAGNYANASVTIKVDAMGPVVVITSPMPGHLFNDTEVTVTWTVTDVSLVARSWRLDIWSWHVIGENTVTLYGLTEGNHTLYLSCHDEAGHYTNVSVTFTIDTIAPTARCILGGNIWSNSWNVTITFSEDIDPVNYTLLINGEDVGTGNFLQNYLVVAMDAPLQGNSLLVNLSFEDLAGNHALLNWTFNFYPQGITVTGTVRDALGDPVQGVKVLLDGNNAGTTDAQGNFSFQAAPGTHRIKLVKEGFVNLTRSIDLQTEEDGPMGILTLMLVEAPDDQVPDEGLGIEVFIAIGSASAAMVGAVLFLRSRKK